MQSLADILAGVQPDPYQQGSAGIMPFLAQQLLTQQMAPAQLGQMMPQGPGQQPGGQIMPPGMGGQASPMMPGAPGAPPGIGSMGGALLPAQLIAAGIY